MAIDCICGIMGSGKSYEATAKKLVPNFAPTEERKGRRIVTNVKGLDIEKIKQYCIKELKSKEEDLGEIIIINDDDIKADNFFPFLTEENNKEIVHDDKSIVKSGDLIIIDEALNFWGKGSKLKDTDYDFFRMHRHFASKETGLTCDMIVIVQDSSLLRTELKNLLQFTYVCKKHTALGLPNHYQLAIYDGHRQTKAFLTNVTNQKYDKKIFPLYNSHVGGKGKEVSTDKRGNIFRSKKLWISLIIFAIIVPFAVSNIFHFFDPSRIKKNPISQGQASSNNLSSSSVNNQAVNINNDVPKFKIVGVIDSPKKRLVFLQDENKNIKMTYANVCTGAGLMLVCMIDNQQVSYYSNFKTNYLSPENINNENKNIK